MRTRHVRALLKRPLGRYLIIGVSVYIFEIAALLAAKASSLPDVTAVTIAYWLGTAVSFFMQKLVTFGDKRMHHRILLPQVAGVCLLLLFNYGFTVLLAHLLRELLPLTAIRTLALGITIFWNFALYKSVIFKNRAVTAS